MCAATSVIACAAMRPATRMRSIVSASLSGEPVKRAGPGRPTYSGRGIDSGTGRSGETTPGATAVMW
jgi:hypothetical protein